MDIVVGFGARAPREEGNTVKNSKRQHLYLAQWRRLARATPARRLQNPRLFSMCWKCALRLWTPRLVSRTKAGRSRPGVLPFHLG